MAADKIIRPDGTELIPINLSEHLGISQEQLKEFSKMTFSVPPVLQASLQEHQQEMIRQTEEMAQAVYEGKQEFIRQMAEATAKENAKAMRTSPFVFDVVVSALASLCGNPTYNTSSSEDSMNDYARDLLRQTLSVSDQTRQGISGNSSSAEEGRAGELDLQIRHNGKQICIYEGLKLESVVEKTIHEHIAKATIKYNPQGVKEVFVVAYVVKQAGKFGDFWKRFCDCLKKYNAEEEYMITWDDEPIDTGMSAIRCLHGIYNMDGEEHNVYCLAVKIQK